MVEAQKAVRSVAIIFIKTYQYLISPLLGPSCRFTPSCSEYTRQAIERYGLFSGILLALKRIGKCHPWHQGGADPVPESITKFSKVQTDD